MMDRACQLLSFAWCDGIACFMAALALSLAPAPAAGQEEATPAAARWREYSFGLSLLPPPGSYIQQPPPPTGAERFYLPNGSAIQVSIEQTQGGGDPAGRSFSSFGVHGPTRIEAGDTTIERGGAADAKMFIRLGDGLTSLEEVMQFTVGQVAAIDPKAVILDQRDGLTLAGHHPAAVIYFRIPAGREPQWILGLGVMQIDPQSFAVLRLESASESFAEDRPLFERTLHSLEIQSPDELDAWRDELLTRADAWRRTINTERIHAALHQEQWFRVVDGDRDVGWIRIEQQPQEYLASNGVSVRIRSRMFTLVRNPRGERDVGAPPVVEKAIDSDNFFFLGDDRETEVWTIHSTLRAAHDPQPNPARANPARRANPPRADQPFSRWEQGAASGPTITLTRGDQRIRWVRPEKAYLSQVESLLLGALLPHDQETMYGFYAYHPESGRLAFLTAQVIPRQTGGFELRIRPTPDAREHLYTYDPAGKLLSWRMPTGRSILAADPQEIQRIWRGR